MRRPLGLLGGEKPEANRLGNEGMIDRQWQKILPPDQINTTVADMCEGQSSAPDKSGDHRRPHSFSVETGFWGTKN
ncbi:MAG: hypothetical protein ABIR36_08215 [Nitrospiraceae bacterium]